MAATKKKSVSKKEAEKVTKKEIEKVTKKATGKSKAAKSVKPVLKGKLTKSLKPGVTVEVISGKHKGETGKVIKVSREKNRIYVDGINEKVDYQRSIDGSTPSQKTLKLMSLHISNVKLIKS